MRRVTTAAVLAAMIATLVPAGAGAAGPVPAAASAATIVAAAGVPDGATLTPMTGGTLTTANTVVANRVVTGDVVFTGSNLTLRNLRVTGSVVLRGDNVTIEDSTVGSLRLSGTAGARVSGVEVSGCTGEDGLHITADSGPVRDVVVEDTWIHTPLVRSESHYDGIQVRGADGLTFRRIVVDLGPYKPQYNAALFIENANGGNRHVTVEDSHFAGGGYTFYSFATDVRVNRSTFTPGKWGILFPDSWVSEIVQFTQNTDGAGAALSLSQLHPSAALPAPTMPARQITLSPRLTRSGAGNALAVDAGGRLYLYANAASRPTPVALLGQGWSGLRVYAPGDWNGDRRNDVVAADTFGVLWLYPGNGAAGLGGRVQIGRGWASYRIIPAGDVNGDGPVDLLAIDATGRLFLYPGSGNGGFGRRIQVGRGWGTFELYAGGDMNGDRRVDILGINAKGQLFFYAGRGGGYFRPAVQVGRGWTGFTFASGADLNGDGRNDLLGRDRTGNVWFYAGRGTGRFAAAVKVATGW